MHYLPVQTLLAFPSAPRVFILAYLRILLLPSPSSSSSLGRSALAHASALTASVVASEVSSFAILNDSVSTITQMLA